jgi:hypothetical protein
MNDWPALDDFLRTDPRDVGCAQAMEMLHVYVELVAAGAAAVPGHRGAPARVRPVRRGLRGTAGRGARRGGLTGT